MIYDSDCLGEQPKKEYGNYSKVKTRTARSKVLIDLPEGPSTVCVLNFESPLYAPPQILFGACLGGGFLDSAHLAPPF